MRGAPASALPALARPAGHERRGEQHNADDERHACSYLVMALMRAADQEVHRVERSGEQQHSKDDGQHSEDGQDKRYRPAARPW
jgi:hypothetical protein